MSELPEGWTRHLSSSCPGKEYYFNANTGANAWDLQEVLRSYNGIGSNGAECGKPNIVSHIHSDADESNKTDNINTIPSVSPSQQSDPESEPEKNHNQSLEVSFSSDDSMVFDEEERREYKRIKSKYKSPRRKSLKLNVEMSNTVRHHAESPPESSVVEFPLEDSNIEKSDLPLLKKETPRKQSSNLLKKFANPGNFGSKYKNYEDEERPTYTSQPEDLPRAPVQGERSSPIESEFPDPSRARNQPVFYHHHEGDLTPEYESPEEFTDEEEDHSAKLEFTESKDHSEDISIDLDSLGEEEEEMEEDDGGLKDYDSVDDYIGFEYEEPPTPTLVKELEEEEECMELQCLDVEDILQEIQSVRDSISTATAMDIDEKSFEEDPGLTQLSSSPGRQVIVVDSSVFISSSSSRNSVTSLLEWPEVRVVVPRLVLQDLQRLKLSEQKTLSVRARAAVRWVENNVVTQTPGQSRELAEQYEAETAEDTILATCRRLLEDGHKVFLATDDAKLSTKAILNQLKSGKAENIFDFLEAKPEDEMSSEARENEENELNILLVDSVRKARSITRDILEAVIRREFKVCYGKLWENMFSIKPAAKRPFWSLANLLMLFSTHHVSLLPQFFPTNSDELKTKLQTVREILLVKQCWRIQDAREVFQEVLKLIEFFKKKDEYDGMVSLCTESLMENLDHLTAKELQRNFKKQILGMTSLNQQRVEHLFTSIWEIINVYTLSFADVLDVSHQLMIVVKKIQFHSRSEAIEELPRFYSTVEELYQSMLRLLTPQDEGRVYHRLFLIEAQCSSRSWSRSE